ncbi:FAD-dependent monooxygenase [Halomonas sp. V046]|uniref:FAD-dependent monooxygenase n=1 Tax=Halomonas sp. V046 TaxID=3459611 RepID=UPI004044B2D0
MRPAGRRETDSLYFDYPHYPYVTPAEARGEPRRHRVAIVGAGPVGVTAALELARHGVASVVLDDKDSVNDGSRAICLSRHSLEILQQLGVEGSFVAKGLGWTRGRTYYRDREILRFSMPHDEHERFAPMINLQQQYIEQYLIDAATASPLIEMRWQQPVTSVEHDDHGITLGVATPEGGYRLQADYLLAADGARSVVRRALGLRLHGEAYEGRYVIADIRLRSDFPTERRALFHCSGLPDSTVLVHRQPDDIWRIDYQLKPDDDADTAVDEAVVRARVGAIVASLGEDSPWELEWWSLYKAHTLALDDYRHGRIMFIGDSAHLVPIFGVRGLNNGLADAVNAGWKLAWVIAGRATDHLLDSYTPERRGATLDVFANAGKSTRFMTPPTRGHRRLRDAALALALDNAYVRDFANPRQVTPYTYAESPLTVADDPGFATGPVPGAPLINRRLGTNAYLLDHLGSGFQLLWFSPTPERVERFADAIAAMLEHDPALVVLAVASSGESAGESSGGHQGGAGADIARTRWIDDSDGSLLQAYGAAPGSLYLVRPDRHVVARWRQPTAEAVAQALATALGEPKGDTARASGRQPLTQPLTRPLTRPLTQPRAAAPGGMDQPAPISLPGIAFADLEVVYDRLADALDGLPEAEEADFLTRLALALAHRVGDRERVCSAIEEARSVSGRLRPGE